MYKRTVLVLAALAALLNILIAVANALDTVEYQAMIEKNSITMGEKVQFLVRVDYPLTTMKPAITSPSFSQFTVLNENETIREEKKGDDHYRVLRRIWLLEPNESGHLSIASAIVTYQDPVSNLLKTGKTNIIFLEVAPRNQQAEKAKAVNADKSTAPNAAPQSGFFWWLVAGGGGVLALLVVVITWTNRSRQKGPSPEEQAQAALQQALVLAEAEDLDGYYKGLHQALLDYLQQKFGINAYILPTEDILQALKHYQFDPDLFGDLEAYFKAADQAKFGGHTTDEDELIKMHGTVDRFIKTGGMLKIKKPRMAAKQRKAG